MHCMPVSILVYSNNAVTFSNEAVSFLKSQDKCESKNNKDTQSYTTPFQI